MAAEELAGRIGQTAEACEALGVARSTLYRRRQPVTSEPNRRPRPHRALDEAEREAYLADYRRRIDAAYPRRDDGVTLFPFRRIFIVATR